MRSHTRRRILELPLPCQTFGNREQHEWRSQDSIPWTQLLNSPTLLGARRYLSSSWTKTHINKLEAKIKIFAVTQLDRSRVDYLLLWHIYLIHEGTLLGRNGIRLWRVLWAYGDTKVTSLVYEIIRDVGQNCTYCHFCGWSERRSRILLTI